VSKEHAAFRAREVNGYQAWWVKDRNITDEVEQWLKNQEITYPFNEEIRIQCMLTFG
jgi:hypothetical protein